MKYSEDISELKRIISEAQEIYDSLAPIKSELDTKNMALFKKLEKLLKEKKVQLQMMEESLDFMKRFGVDDIVIGKD